MPPRVVLAAWALVVGLASLGTCKGDEASDRSIAAAVARLGHQSWAERERASRELWHQGAEAESALRGAMASPDREIARRAAHLVELLEWCITPDTTPAEWATISRVRATTNPDELDQLRCEMVISQPRSYPAIVGLLRQVQDPAARAAMASSIAGDDRVLLRDVVANASPALAARLLDELARTGDEVAIRDHVAFHLVRGTLAGQLTRLAADGSPTGLRRLYYARRALGDYAGAADVAATFEEPEYAALALSEGGHWARRYDVERERRTDLDDNANLGVLAALANLAEKPQARDAATRRLFRRIDRAISDETASETLVALGEVELVLVAVRNQGVEDWRRVLQEILHERNDYEPLIKALSRDFDSGSEQWFTQLKLIRTLAALGRGDAVQATVDAALAGRTKDAQLQGEAAVLQVLGPLRQPRMARKIFVTFRQGDVVAKWQDWLKMVWPDRDNEIDAWWPVIIARNPKQDRLAMFDELSELLEGRADAVAIVAAARTAPGQNDTGRAAAFAETCRRVGRGDVGAELMAKVVPEGDVSSSMPLAHFAIRAGLWAQAEAASRPALEANPLAAEPLLVRIEALDRLGRHDEATVLIDRAHALALASSTERLELARVLERIGRVAEARRVLEVAWRTALEVNVCEECARAAWQLAPDDDLAALETWVARATAMQLARVEQCESSVTSAMIQARELAIARGHRARLAAKPGEALAHAKAAIAIDPNDADANALHQAVADNAEAARVRDAAFQLYETQVARDPTSAHFQDRLAWFSARVRARLDQALVAAERAVELEPSVPRYHATLAEVRFQRGDRGDALAAIDRALLLAPDDGHYHRQRRRFADGDPRSEPK